MSIYKKIKTISLFSYFVSHLTLAAFEVPQVDGTFTLARPLLGVAVSGTFGIAAQPNENQIVFFDTRSSAFSGSLPVGLYPQYVDIAGRYGFISNTYSNNVSVVDLFEKKIAGTIAVGPQPSRIAINGTYGAVGCTGDNSLYYFDTNSWQFRGSVAVQGTLPTGIAWSGTTSYNVNVQSNSFSAVDAQSLTLSGTYATNFRPRDIAISGTYGFICGDAPNRLQRFDVSTRALGASITSLNAPQLVVVDGTSSIVSFSTLLNYFNPQSLGILGTVGGFTQVGDLDIGGTTTYLTDSLLNQIVKLDNNTYNRSGTIVGIPSVAFNPQTIATSGNIAAVACSSKQLLFFDINQQKLTGSITFDQSPYNMAISGSKGIVAIGQTVTFFDPQTQIITGSVDIGSIIRNVAISGTTAALTTSNNFVALVDTVAQVVSRTFSAISPSQVALYGTVGVFTKSNFINFFNSQTGVIIGTIANPLTVADRIALSEDSGCFTRLNKLVFFSPKTYEITGSLTYSSLESIFSPSYLGETVGVAVSKSLSIQDYVSFVDATTQRIVGTVVVGDNPNSLANNGQSWVVANNASQTINFMNSLVAFPDYDGNAGATVKLFDQSTPSWPQKTLALKQSLLREPTPMQQATLEQIQPSYKVLQFALDKLDLVIEKRLENFVEQPDVKKALFAFAGYDHLNQDQTLYTGYSVDSFYQFLGGIYQFSKAKVLSSIGVSESYLSLNPLDGHAKYQTIYTNLGLSKRTCDFDLGLKGMFGYSFIDAHRKMTLIDAKAATNHGAWQISFDAKAAYLFKSKKVPATIYDNLSYFYNHENNYTETGSSGANFSVKNEDLSVMRNAFGFSLASKPKKLSVFMDAAWLFEYYFSSSAYSGAFSGTDVWGVYKQTMPTRNYARVLAGFKGSNTHFNWSVSYNGLYGKRYQESGVSLDACYKF